MVRSDGVISRFDRSSGDFVAFDQDGTLRTFFRPVDGERYFMRQATRTHDGP
jgi:pyocin large subunit-like protein